MTSFLEAHLGSIEKKKKAKEAYLRRLSQESAGAGEDAIELFSPIPMAPTVTAQCTVHGPGLESATTRKLTTFTIQAAKADGSAQTAGGDPFVVVIRGRGEKVRPKLIDHGTGRYTVGFKPYSSGKLMIGITLGGEAVPGSPFTCRVCNLVASAPCCVVRGAALREAIARQEQHFEVQFRDLLGNVAHAEDLDVYCEEAQSDDADADDEPEAEVEAEVEEEEEVTTRKGRKRTKELVEEVEAAAPAATSELDDDDDDERSVSRPKAVVQTLRTAECTVTSKKPRAFRGLPLRSH